MLRQACAVSSVLVGHRCLDERVSRLRVRGSSGVRRRQCFVTQQITAQKIAAAAQEEENING